MLDGSQISSFTRVCSKCSYSPGATRSSPKSTEIVLQHIALDFYPVVSRLLDPDLRAHFREILGLRMNRTISRLGLGFNHPCGLIAHGVGLDQTKGESLRDFANKRAFFGPFLLIAGLLGGRFMLALGVFLIQLCLLRRSSRAANGLSLRAVRRS